ncbi:MAG: hydrogenase expression/formation protein HypE [Candidatus Omnitrophica bacterium]|nr:hydrogenase expression/formation protein HypE [Candidatus Omnitrophota bacterium]
MPEKKILLGHGSGGRLMHSLIRKLLLTKFDNPVLRELSDSARLSYKEKLAFTTDSFVVSPLKFPGGDIGKLAVCGTVNDLVMAGAVPEFLSLALIIEEGLDYRTLEEIADSIAATARKAGVLIVAGDIKVVEKLACDKIFINTSGVGRVLKNRNLSRKNIRPGDKVIITGNIGRHGMAVLAKRKELDLGFGIQSDCAALNGLILPILEKTSAIKFMRDPTRGGVATTLNEVAEGLSAGVALDEKNIPLSGKVRAAAELLGIDPLYIACEGAAIMIVEKNSAKKILKLLQQHPLGCHARVAGEVVKEPKGKVVLNTVVGTQRIVDMLTSEPLPRIC